MSHAEWRVQLDGDQLAALTTERFSFRRSTEQTFVTGDIQATNMRVGKSVTRTIPKGPVLAVSNTCFGAAVAQPV